MKKQRKGRVPKRYHWLIKIIRERNYAIGAEIGCMKGNNARRLLHGCPNLILYCVDLWDLEHPAMTDYCRETWVGWDMRAIKKSFNKQVAPYKNRVIELRGVSWEMADKIENKSLDFIFIDADHSYESVKKDILAWAPKVKIDGIISGHDINIPGVYEAVNELIPNWKDTGINQVWYSEKKDYVD